MGMLILRPETEEVLHRPDLTEAVGGYDDAVFLEVPADFTLKDKRIDWGALSVVDDVETVRNRRWEEAQAYFEIACSAGFALPGIGVVQTNPRSREAILLLKDEARDRLDAGDTGWSTSFKNEANAAVPVTAPEILAIYAALRAFLGECYRVCQGIRDQLDAAVAAGATGAEINAIDITAGYPANGATGA